MENQFSRTELLLGANGMKRLKQSRVAIFGVGGVGGYAAEALARSGVGTFDLIDNDRICVTNLNRQIIATYDTIGRYKVDVMKERILSINPEATVNGYRCFFLPENAKEFDFSQYSYVIDAVDTVTAKIELAMQTEKYKVPFISSMGAGNKLEPTKFEVTDIYKTSTCPLARVMRRELKKRNIKHLKVVYSTEEAKTPLDLEERKENRRSIPGSVAFVPSVAGMILASEVIKDLVYVYGKTKEELPWELV